MGGEKMEVSHHPGKRNFVARQRPLTVDAQCEVLAFGQVQGHGDACLVAVRRLCLPQISRALTDISRLVVSKRRRVFLEPTQDGASLADCLAHVLRLKSLRCVADVPDADISFRAFDNEQAGDDSEAEAVGQARHARLKRPEIWRYCNLLAVTQPHRCLPARGHSGALRQGRGDVHAASDNRRRR